MIKTIFILDTSGSMTEDQIKKGIEIIYTKGDISGRESPAIFCWNSLEQRFPEFVNSLKSTYPQSTIHLVGDAYFTEEDLQMVDQVTVVPPEPYAPNSTLTH
jgi:hypothetical protein